jgi:hypothetical protein
MLVYTMQWHSCQKQPNLKLETQPKQLVGSLTLAFALPDYQKSKLFFYQGILKEEVSLYG